jgi:tetratricopeptide (TPR) repeat protein
MRLVSFALLSALMAAVSLSACVMQESRPGAAPVSPGESPSGTAQPAPPVPTPLPERPSAPPPRQFRLGAAANALVGQSHQQAGRGDYGQAAATLERALRIEPDNPLLWIELGRVRLEENNATQADAMAKKALILATGDAAAQAAAWRLIADSLRARGRNAEAHEADRRAGGPALR